MPATEFKMPPKRIANRLMNALRGGVVPRDGAEYIAVGRSEELEAILRDVEVIEDGGATFRFIEGPFGSGKSFLFSIIRSHVTKKGFVVMDADLSPERKLIGTHNEGIATYRELVKNMCTAARPLGGALPLILDKWINEILFTLKAQGIEDGAIDAAVSQEIYHKCASLRDLVHGFEFASLMEKYYIAYRDGDDALKDKIMKWLRAEYQNKREAKSELGVSVIITDKDWYDYIKLIAAFVKMAGYAGTFVIMDEMINLYKISNKTSRQNNYEKLLSMYNDTLQGKATYLGLIMGATPQSIEDTRRGVFSYEALRSRLESGRLATDNMKDLLSPIIRIRKLNNEELFVLLERLAQLHAELFATHRTFETEEIQYFLGCELGRVGAEDRLTPREVIRDFIELMNLLLQNPDKSVKAIMSGNGFVFSDVQIEDIDSNLIGESEDEFSSFSL